MPICVEITMQDDGSLSVKQCEPEEYEEGEDAGQTVKSMDEAFSIAEGILTGGEDPAAAEEQAFNQTVGGKETNMADMLAGKQGGM